MYGTVWCREDGLNSNSSFGIGSDWFEGALVRPDLVLSDVANALNSSAVPQVCKAHSLFKTCYFGSKGTLCPHRAPNCACATKPKLIGH